MKFFNEIKCEWCEQPSNSTECKNCIDLKIEDEKLILREELMNKLNFQFEDAKKLQKKKLQQLWEFGTNCDKCGHRCPINWIKCAYCKYNEN